MKLSSQDEFELAKCLRDMSVSIGNYRFEKWNDLSEEQRKTLGKAEWSLLNASSDVLTSAIGLVLDETQWSFDRLKELTNSANETLKQLEVIRKAIRVATAAVSLAAAIVSKDLGAIGKNAKELYDIIHEDPA